MPVNNTTRYSTQPSEVLKDGRGVIYRDTLSSLKQVTLSDSVENMEAVITTSGRAGRFFWKQSDLSSEVSADPQEGIYIAPNDDLTGASGAWVRHFSEGSINVQWFGAIGDNITDDYAAIQAACDAVPDRIQGINGAGNWAVTKGAEVYFPVPSSGQYLCGDKIKIAPEKNTQLRCDVVAGATINYTGPGDVAVEFQPGGISRTIGVSRLHIHGGGIAVVGGNNGMLYFDQPQVTRATNHAIWFVDAADYEDGYEYTVATGGYTGPNSSAGVNTVHCYLFKPNLNYNFRGLTVQATTILLFTCFKPRINTTTREPLILDCIHAEILSPEFQGVNAYTGVGYVNIPSNINTAAYLTLRNPRFGAEEFTDDGTNYRPPVNTVVIGETGAWVGGNPVTDLTIEDGLCFGNNTTADTQRFILANRRLLNCKIRNNRFRNYQSDLVLEQNFSNTSTEDLTCEWSGNVLEASVVGDVFSTGGRGWFYDDKKISARGADAPQATEGAALGSGGSVTVTGNDSAGVIVATTGTGASSGEISQISFTTRFENASVVIFPRTSTAAALDVYSQGVSSTGYNLRVIGSLADSTTYSWSYVVIDTE